MNYTGLYNPFKLNRSLSDEDIKYQLRQDFTAMGAADAVALDDTVVIKMNSTYLELVDKYYSDRGMFEFFTAIMFSSSRKDLKSDCICLNPILVTLVFLVKHWR